MASDSADQDTQVAVEWEHARLGPLGRGGVARWAPYMLLGAIFIGALIYAGRPGGVPTMKQRIASIASEVRCPTCQGLSAQESDAPAAKAVQAFISEQVVLGRTNAQIKAELERRYGADILLRPPAHGVSVLVWAIPVVAGVAAVAGLALAFARWRSRALLEATDEDRVLVERARRPDRKRPSPPPALGP